MAYSKNSQIDKLMELKQLYEQGILTKEEMENEKKKILGESFREEQKQSDSLSRSESVVNTPEESFVKNKEKATFFKTNKIYIFVGICLLIIVGLIYLFKSNLIKKEPPTPDEILKRLEKDVDDVDFGMNNTLNDFENLINNCHWIEHYDGFQYPDFFRNYEASIDEIPADVEIYTYDSVDLCYWPSLGVWSVADEFPSEGLYLSPTETVKNITYRAESKGIASGYTNSGKIYYLKQKIMKGEGVDHSKFLVLINPPEYNKSVEKMTNIIVKW